MNALVIIRKECSHTRYTGHTAVIARQKESGCQVPNLADQEKQQKSFQNPAADTFYAVLSVCTIR